MPFNSETYRVLIASPSDLTEERQAAGDREVSTRALARAMKVGSVQPCAPDVAERHSGYKVGGTSPFGLRKALPIYMEATIGALPRVFVNGGKRGYLVGIDTADLIRLLQPTAVDAAQAARVSTQ